MSLIPPALSGTNAILLVLSCQALSQQQSTPALLSAGTIDGSKTPTLIPDLTAYRLVFRAFAEPPNATPAQLIRQRRKLSHIATSEADYTAFKASLTDFTTKYRSLQAARAIPSSSQQAFVTGWQTLVGDTLSQLSQRVTPTAMTRFQAFVQRAKHHMVITPLPMTAMETSGMSPKVTPSTTPAAAR